MADAEYIAKLQQVLKAGIVKTDKHATRSMTGMQFRFDMALGFPLLTVKHVPFRLVATELQWFLLGRSDVQWLQDRNVHIWDDDAEKAVARGFAYEKGELGPIYGKQWRNWCGIDQIKALNQSIKDNPYSRRHVVSAWNVQDVPKMVLPPCHMMFQIVCADMYMDLVVTMRSGDIGLGIPFNMASYALLLMLLSKIHTFIPRYVVINVGDAHVYENHVDALSGLLTCQTYNSPDLFIPDEIKSLDDFCKVKNFYGWIRNYNYAGKLILPLNT